MRRFFAAIVFCAVALSAWSAPKDEATVKQLRQLAAELSAYVVGTPDSTFRSCTYTDDKITFEVNPQSNIGRYRLANPFEEDFYESLLTRMFSGNPKQGIMVMQFLKQTAGQICFIIPRREESTVYVGDVITRLQQLMQQQNNTDK